METELDIVAVLLIGIALGVAFPLFLKANGTRPLALMPVLLMAILFWGTMDGFTADQQWDQHLRRIAFPLVTLGCTAWVMWRQRGKSHHVIVKLEAEETEERAL